MAKTTTTTKTYRVTITVTGEDPDSMTICNALDMWNENTPDNVPKVMWQSDEELV